MKLSKSKFCLLTVFVLLFIIMLIFLIVKRPFGSEKSANDFYVGGDISSLMEVEENGGKFYDYDGKEKDVLEILKEETVFC